MGSRVWEDITRPAILPVPVFTWPRIRRPPIVIGSAGGPLSIMICCARAAVAGDNAAMSRSASSAQMVRVSIDASSELWK